MPRPRLYILAGLPGSGKSTVAELLARRLRAAYVRIDTIEQGLRDLCSIDVQGEGYRLAYRVAADSLRLGTNVVADSCNPISLTRLEWQQTATDAGAHYVNVEVVCSNRNEHRTRVETRRNTVPGLRLPTWDEVAARPYDPWTAPRIILDTSGRSPEKCVDELLATMQSEA